jgi:hypothetical protein
MDELSHTLHAAVDAALAGDLQALLIAQWLLSELRTSSTASRAGVDGR